VKPYSFRIEEKTSKVLDNLKSWEIPFSFAGILRATLEKELRVVLKVHQAKIVTGFIKTTYAEILTQALDERQARNSIYSNCGLFCASIWENYGIRLSPSELKRQCQFYFFNLDRERMQNYKKEKIEREANEDQDIENLLGADVPEDVSE